MGTVASESKAGIEHWTAIRARFERAVQASVEAAMERCELEAGATRDSIAAFQGLATDSLTHVSRMVDRYISAVASVADLVQRVPISEHEFDRQGCLSQVGVLRQTFDVHRRMLERPGAERTFFMSGVGVLIEDVQRQLSQVVREGLQAWRNRDQANAPSDASLQQPDDGLLAEERAAMALLAAHAAQQGGRQIEVVSNRQEHRGQS